MIFRSRKLLAPLIAGLTLNLALLTAPAKAQVAGPIQTPLFRSFVGTGVANSPTSNFLVVDFEGYLESPTPENTLLNFDHTYSGPLGDVRFHGQAAANYRGFWSTGTRVEAWVDDAYYPTSNDVGTSPPFGYYVVGGMGSWTRHRFVSPDSLTGPFGQFEWHVTGDREADLGRADSRLDFGVGKNVTSFDDTYNPTYVPNLLTEFGPGQFQYTTGVELDTVLDFMFWSSSFWTVSQADLQTLGSNRTDLHALSEFMRTFHMDSIELFNGDGAPVENWSLIDEDTGRVIWNQNGRIDIAAVPEPGALAAFAGLLLPGALLLRRRSRR